MLTGRRFHVLEQQGSQGLNPGDVYFTRVVTAGGISLMFGAAPYVFPARFQIDALDWRDLLFGRRKRARKDLDKFEAEILDCYHVFAERLLNPTIPKLRNTDGDELAPTSITYGLTIPIPEAFTRLLPLATLGVEEHVSDVVEDADGVMTSAVLQWVKSGNRKMKQWDNTILGSLLLGNGELRVEVNSARRADRIVREIRRRLGSNTVLKVRSVEDMAKHLEEMTARRQSGAPLGARAPEERSPELDEYEDQLYCQHLESWIDTRIPALGHRTPREMSHSARGRERLRAILAGMVDGKWRERPARRDARAAMYRVLGLGDPPGFHQG